MRVVGDDRRRPTARSELLRDGPAAGRAGAHAWTGAVDAALVALAAPGARAVTGGSPSSPSAGTAGPSCARAPTSTCSLAPRPARPARSSSGVVREVVYPLWDVGLTVGYAVRDRREAVAAIDDLDTATAMLDLRPSPVTAGSPHQVRAETMQRLPAAARTVPAGAGPGRRGPARAGGRRGRGPRTGPQGRRGRPARRAVASWAAAALVGTTGIDPLVPAGYLAAPDRRRLTLRLRPAARGPRGPAPRLPPSARSRVRTSSSGSTCRTPSPHAAGTWTAPTTTSPRTSC